MTDYDAIVIGAGHNGLTAAAIMARGGLRVLCLEKNQYVGGMASTTELMKGYKFEIAGSVLFPMADEIWDDLGLEACPTYDADVMSVNIGRPDQSPMIFYSDPEQLMEHIAETNGMDAVMGMAEIMMWADAPARAIGRFEVRKPPKSLDEMFACANNEAEREAIKVAMFGSVMDVIDQFLPDKERHGMLRGMLAFLAVNSTYRGPYTPGSAMCLAFAMATTGSRMMRKLDGGIGALSQHVLGLFQEHGGTLRLHGKVDEITTDAGRVTGVRLTDGEEISAPVVVSNLDLTSTLLRLMDRDSMPEKLVRRVESIDHRAAYIQMHFALDGLPEFTGPYEVLNEGNLRASMGMFGTPEEMQRDFEDCCRGDVPAWPSMGMQIPSMYDPSLAPPGKHAASSYAFYFPIVGSREEQSKLKDVMAERVVAKVAGMAPNFPDIIDRELTYASYAFEMMFGATDGDFCHGLIHPDLMPPFRPGPRGWPDNPIPVEGLYLCGAGCHGGPGVTFTPGYNCGYEVLEAADRAPASSAAGA
jgi:phytoene dehydrogenase-like protein